MRDVNFAQICDDFLQYGKVIKNYQPATITGYRVTFKLFQEMTDIESLGVLSQEMIERFLYDGRLERDWSACTFRSYLKQLRAFCNWCVKRGLISENYTNGIDKPPLERRLPQCLSAEQCERIFEYAYHLKYHFKTEGIRNRAILGTMIFAGLRLSEVVNLKRLDVDLKSGTITVRQGKWNKDRQIPIATRLMYFLQEYADTLSKTPSRHVSFFSKVNGDIPLQARGVQNICRKVSNRSGVYFTPHMLRHTFATMTYQGSRDIYAVSGLLGHAKVETTMIYTQLSLDDKRNSVEQHALNGYDRV